MCLPSVVSDAAAWRERELASYRRAATGATYAVNLCRSLTGRRLQRVTLTDEMMERAVANLIEHKGGVLAEGEANVC